MNGQLKNLFHSRSKIFHQLIFNTDVRQTLQLVLPWLAVAESEQTLHFLQTSSRHNMVQIDACTYILGQSKLIVATPDQRDIEYRGSDRSFFQALHARAFVHLQKLFQRMTREA